MVKFIKPKLALVTWGDAHSPPGNETFAHKSSELDNVHGPLVIITVGWILKQDEVGITLSGEDCLDGDYRSITFIPRSLVMNIEYIRQTRKKPCPTYQTPKDDSSTPTPPEKTV